MNPAVSVIFFTVLSGAGFGFIVLLGAGYPMPQGALIALFACGLAIGLTATGLIASTFHLGHPERAWRALSQWRSSWLSREGVMSLVTLALFATYGFFWIFLGKRIAPLGWLSSAGAFVSVISTAMIYTQLKTVPHWHSTLTPASYLLYSLTGGVLIAASLGSADQIDGAPVSAICIVALLCAWALKLAWWRRAARSSLALAGSTPETATGLGFLGRVRLLERPHTGPNYLTKEMVYRIGRKHADKVRALALVLGALAPIAICALVLVLSANKIWLSAAFVFFMMGLFAERWLFFAEAEHSVSLYY